MMGIGRFAAALILGITVLGSRVQAQDTSLMDMNMAMGCMLMAGMHEMQVAVFQSGAREDSCEDIPAPGPTVITLSSTSKELRDLTTEVRLVKGEAAADSAAGDAKLEPVTLAHLPPKTYPTGIISLDANFDNPGKYALLVTVSDNKEMTMSGQIPMTVGAASRQWTYAFILSGVVVAAGFGFYIWDHRRKHNKHNMSAKSS
jgi:hypothetical protein